MSKAIDAAVENLRTAIAHLEFVRTGYGLPLEVRQDAEEAADMATARLLDVAKREEGEGDASGG